MKKLFLLATLVGTASLLHATTISAPPALVGNNALEGDDAYEWGISIAVPTGEEVASAEIDFSGVELTVSGNSKGTGIIYTDLLKSQATGLTTATDNDDIGDYWATKFSGANITSLGSEYFKSVKTTLKWSDVLNTAELAALNSYLAADNGIFDIGIDPDCHFNVGSITFTYTLSPVPHNTVPDVATTAFLLVISLAGLEVFRRQFVPVKATAKAKV
jgi:hypothetical protein